MHTLRASPIHHLAIGERAEQAFTMRPGKILGHVDRTWNMFQGRNAFVIVTASGSPRHGDRVFSGLTNPVWHEDEPFPGTFEGYAIKAPYGWTVVQEKPTGTILVEGSFREWKEKHHKPWSRQPVSDPEWTSAEADYFFAEMFGTREDRDRVVKKLATKLSLTP